MVDEAGNVLDPLIIKRTQETLGKIVTKPVLTEKLLRKPPFKFIHDIMTSIIRSTGYMDGLFTEDELNSENMKDRESKIAFLQKAIEYVSGTNGEIIDLRPGKTVAGHEPEKTNAFFQALAKAIEKQRENGRVETVGAAAADVNPKKEKSSSSKKNSETKVKKEVTKKDVSKDGRAKAGESSKASSSHTRSVEKVRTNEKNSTEEKKRTPSNNRTSVRTTTKEKEKESTRTKTRDNSKENKEVHRSKSRDRPSNKGRKNENDNEVDRLKERRRSKELSSTSKDARKTSTVKKKIEENGLRSPEKERVRDKKVENGEVVAADEAIASEEVIESLQPDEVLNGSVDVEVKSSHSSNASRLNSSSVIAGRPPTGRPATTKQNGVDDEGKRVGSSHSSSPSVELISQEPEAQNGTTETLKRPSTSTIRRSSARPPTARPAAPRVRVVEMSSEDVTVQQPIKQVSNIILDGDANKDNEDDETFVIEEVPILMANNHITGELLTTDVTDGKPHGSLVTQILETKKDLESGSERTTTSGLQRVEIDSHLVSDGTRLKEREKIAREMDRLREGVQTLSRNANPLGKHIDYLQEDVDSMLRELDRWTLESKQHEQELERELSKGDVELDDLNQRMSEIEEAIEDQHAKIRMVKANIIRNEEKIQKLVSSAKVK